MACGVPIIPGCSEPLQGRGRRRWRRPSAYGFPVILKAAAGGGGRGMRRCDMPEEVVPAFELVKNEAREGLRQ